MDLQRGSRKRHRTRIAEVTLDRFRHFRSSDERRLAAAAPWITRGMLLALARALVPQCERRNASTDELIGSELLFVRLGPGVMPCVGLGLVAK
jgi:hypothetical protein